jgi:predicted metal-binding membrane protein
MRPVAHTFEAWLFVLGSASLAAWSMLAFQHGGFSPPALCAAGTWPVTPTAASVGLALDLITPAHLASSSALMVVAMMLPLTVKPLRHVRDRSFASRRARAMLLFIAGYMAVSMAAGAALQTLALAARSAEAATLPCLGLAVVIAVVWQISPAKQWCLNRCHRRPQLAAFGAAADCDALAYGLRNGASCAGACWALMWLSLLVERGHLPAMLAVTLFLMAERLENPAPLAWRWRGPGKALRIAMGRCACIWSMTASLRGDDGAVGASGHQAILHLAARSQFASQPQPHHQQDDGDQQPCNRRASASALFGIGHYSGSSPRNS